MVVIDKEDGPARHQTGHNSGVIHSGLYYAPGSAKARLCVAGRRLIVEYCTERDLPFEMCGKLVVASEESELERLARIFERGTANGLVGLRMVDEREMAEIEPAVRGLRAIWVPETGIVDYGQVARTIAAVPFRGDYYVLRTERQSLIRGLVYPVPDPRFPFLGVHFTRRIGGGVWLGPNAVLAFAREGYRRTDIDLGDLAESLTYSGFRRLAATHWRTGLAELARDYRKSLFLDALRRYVPELTDADLLPGPSGVRAQAVDPDGGLLDDFLYDTAPRVLNVRNAPSPAATSSLALAREFVDRLESTFTTA